MYHAIPDSDSTKPSLLQRVAAAATSAVATGNQLVTGARPEEDVLRGPTNKLIAICLDDTAWKNEALTVEARVKLKETFIPGDADSKEEDEAIDGLVQQLVKIKTCDLVELRSLYSGSTALSDTTRKRLHTTIECIAVALGNNPTASTALPVSTAAGYVPPTCTVITSSKAVDTVPSL